MIFYKLNGIGNDYIFVDTAVQKVENPSELARKLSNRNTAVGSDGLVLIFPSGVADVRMEIYNKDGSRAEMCGNAIRCVVKYLHDVLGILHDVYLIATDAGIRAVTVEEDKDGKLLSAEVEMGYPEFLRTVKLSEKKTEYVFDRISVGNPHAVTFLERLPEDIASLGERFSTDSAFPSGANIEFCKAESRHKLQVKVYERGSGVTLACGTGATAAVFAAIRRGYCESPVEVVLPGGRLEIRTQNGKYFMKGSADLSFRGEIQKE